MVGTVSLRYSKRLINAMMNSKLLSEVRETVATYHMLSKGDTVLVALSGGADSISLLSVLLELKEEWSLILLAAHVNHGIRGAEAERDEQFCKSFCDEKQIPLFVAHYNVPALAKEQGLSEETCGRNLRYQFFEDVRLQQTQSSTNASFKIATAHNADDAVETLLFHLARGTGLKGLTGIPPVRDHIIRPLINSPRTDIEAYLKEQNLSFVKDSSNEDTQYARNRIRHSVVPELSCINEKAVSNMTRLMDLLRQDDALLQRLAEELRLQAVVPNREASVTEIYHADVLATADPALTSRALATILQRATGIAPEQKHITAVMKLLTTEGKVQISTGIYVSVKGNLLTCVSANDHSLKRTPAFAVKGINGAVLPIGTVHFRITEVALKEGSEELFRLSNSQTCLDYDKLTGKGFTFRNRRPGDRYTPRFRNLSKSLKNLFNEAAIPEEKRDDLLILEQDGRIVWLEGFGCAQDYMVTKETTRVMEISIDGNQRSAQNG